MHNYPSIIFFISSNSHYSKEDEVVGFNLNGSKIILDISGHTQIHGIKDKEDTVILIEELEKIIQKAFC